MIGGMPFNFPETIEAFMSDSPLNMDRSYRRPDIVATKKGVTAASDIVSTNQRCNDSSSKEPIERTPFGWRLFNTRKERGLTQAQLAQIAGIAQSTLAENERINSASTHTAQLADALRINARWLATAEGPKEAASELPSSDRLVYEVGVLSQSKQAVADSIVKGPGESRPLSPLATELGTLLDLITDQVGRAQAYSSASQAIVDVLNRTGGKPTDKPDQQA